MYTIVTVQIRLTRNTAWIAVEMHSRVKCHCRQLQLRLCHKDHLNALHPKTSWTPFLPPQAAWQVPQPHHTYSHTIILHYKLTTQTNSAEHACMQHNIWSEIVVHIMHAAVGCKVTPATIWTKTCWEALHLVLVTVNHWTEALSQALHFWPVVKPAMTRWGYHAVQAMHTVSSMTHTLCGLLM